MKFLYVELMIAVLINRSELLPQIVKVYQVLEQEWELIAADQAILIDICSLVCPHEHLLVVELGPDLYHRLVNLCQ